MKKKMNKIIDSLPRGPLHFERHRTESKEDGKWEWFCGYEKINTRGEFTLEVEGNLICKGLTIEEAAENLFKEINAQTK